MAKIQVVRTVQLPDPLRISRYRKIPELGPRILFFSGGSALTGLSRTLKYYTHNSIHLVTSFDSGGSSAELRRAFAMPAIGDLRSRLMALADETVLGHPEIYDLFNTRFPRDGSQKALLEKLKAMAAGKSEQIADIANPMRRLICNQLGYFLDVMPEDFDLRGASIGNLILAGGYLNNHKHLDPICFLFSKLVNVLGTVRAIVNEDLHLAAELEDGSHVIGQHRITGKETRPLETPIRRIMLSRQPDRLDPVQPELKKKNRKLIESAELICYPPGSFYSSLLANLLPSGTGRSIAENDCPKVWIPNLGRDPEQFGLRQEDCLRKLISVLKADFPQHHCATRKLLNFVLVDSRHGHYPDRLTSQQCKDLGVQLVDTRLVSKKSQPWYDNEALVSTLLSLV